MHSLRKYSRVIGSLNVAAFTLIAASSIVWHNTQTGLGAYLFYNLLYGGVLCAAISLFAQACRYQHTVYKLCMLLFVYVACMSLLTKVFSIPVNDNVDLLVTMLFVPKLYFLLKKQGNA